MLRIFLYLQDAPIDGVSIGPDKDGIVLRLEDYNAELNAHLTWAQANRLISQILSEKRHADRARLDLED